LIGDAAADDPRASLQAWLATNRPPEQPHKEGRALVVVLVIATAAAIAAAVYSLLNPPPVPDPSTLAVVTASHELATAPGACSVDIRYPTGETSTLPQAPCMARGDIVITSNTPEGQLQAKRLHKAARFAGAFFSAAIAFGITAAIAGAGAIGYTAWRRRRRPT